MNGTSFRLSFLLLLDLDVSRGRLVAGLWCGVEVDSRCIAYSDVEVRELVLN